MPVWFDEVNNNYNDDDDNYKSPLWNVDVDSV